MRYRSARKDKREQKAAREEKNPFDTRPLPPPSNPPTTLSDWETYKREKRRRMAGNLEKGYVSRYASGIDDEKSMKSSLAPGTVGLDQLTPELREYLGLPESLERKECPRCEQPRLMSDGDYLCRECR